MAFSSYFEATPPKRRESIENDEIPILVFRPFGNAPKIFFKNVPVGDRVSKSLLLRNPQTETLEIELLKLPPSDAGITFSCESWQLCPRQESTLEVIWQPRREGKSIYSVHLKTNANARFYFSIVCVSVLKKPMKKKGHVTQMTTNARERVVLRSTQVSKKDHSLVKKSSLCKESLSLKSKLESKRNAYSSCEVKAAQSLLQGGVSKLTTSTYPIATTEVAIAPEDDVKNCSSETYDVISPGRNLSADLNEATVAVTSTFTCSQVQYVKKEVDMFADMVFSPILPSGSFQPRQGGSRETFTLSTPFSCISKTEEMSSFVSSQHERRNTPFIKMERISDDSLSPVSPIIEQKIQCGELETPVSTPLLIDSTISQKTCDNTPKFLNFNFSPVKEDKDIDVSGISELDEGLANYLPSNKNTFEIPLPPFTPVQISRTGSISFNAGKSVKSNRKLESEFCIERTNIPESGTPHISVHNILITPSVDKTLSNYDTAEVEYSKTLEEQMAKSETSIKKYLTMEDDLLPETTDAKWNANRNEPKSHKAALKTSHSIQMTPININFSSTSSCMVESFTESKGIETNYLTFSPPSRCNSATKENISPQMTEKITSKRFRKPLNENIQFSVKKESSKLTSSQARVKKEVNYAIPSLVLSSKKKKIIEKEVTLMDTDRILAEHTNPSYCFTATMVNPFINSAVFYDQQWFDEREKEFVRWLNVLLTPPEQLTSSDELPKVDVADLWKKSCNSEVALAPSRETVSSRYLVNHRLDSLRRKACTMFRLPSVAQVLSKVIVQIEKGILSVRKDRNIIRDIGLKTTAIELLLCYNPLWLRIGLETVMGKTIPLESNSDRVGIIGFIARNILSDPYLVERYAYAGVTNMFKPGFEEAMKKHILKKFFLVVFFLDYAKENKLIFHNPCLFCRNAQYKESRDLLLTFAREFLSGIGDITKHLRSLGYVVKHKQTFLDEFNYAVRHLGSDLRDGVRLTKVTEIILQESSLSSCLRTPAISKLQKIHNVKTALTALSKAGHVVEGDITAKDLVEGHREKTMSLLWQIIHKFQLSRFNSAASSIQNWYRSLPICISRRIWLRKDAMRRRLIEDKASTVIQRWWRGYMARKQYKVYISSIYRIQNWYKSAMLMRQQHTEYLKMRNAVVRIQRFARRVLKIKESTILVTKKTAVSKISMWYFNIKLARNQEIHYRKMKIAAVSIQRWFRAVYVTRQLRLQFVLKKSSATFIQRWYRNVLIGKTQRQLYLKQKEAAIIIQRLCRVRIVTRQLRSSYLHQRSAAILIQRWYRACTEMKKQRRDYLRLHTAVCKIQTLFRAKRQLCHDMQSFIQTRNAILKIQSWFRSIIFMRLQRTCYLEMRTSAIRIQNWYIATKLMQKQRKLYLHQRTATLIIQQRFRALRQGRQQKKKYDLQRQAVVAIKSWYRHVCIMKLQRKQFLKEKDAVIFIQRNFRAMMLARKQRYMYVTQRNAVLKIQMWYRACVVMKHQRLLYIKHQTAARKIQTYFRSKKMMQQCLKAFKEKKNAAVTIQIWYRACLAMRSQRIHYLKQQIAARKIQLYFRSRKLMQKHRKAFNDQRTAAKRIQVWFRCTVLMKQERLYYLKMRTCTTKIQTWFRATNQMRQQRNLYLRQRNAAVKIQQKFRALRTSRMQQQQYYLQKKSAVKVQKWFRNALVTRQMRQKYLEMRCEVRERHTMQMRQNAAVKIQTWYRVCVTARESRKENMRQRVSLYNNCESLTTTSVHSLEVLPVTKEKEAVRRIEQWYRYIRHRREQVEMQKRSEEERQHAALVKCATKIQACWRGYRSRKILSISDIIPNIEPSKKYVLDERFSLRAKYLKALSSFQFLPCLSYTVLLSAGLLIECAVKLSPEICEEFLVGPHLSTVVLLLETMNRSVPAENLLDVLLKIVTHVLRHPLGIHRVLENERSIPTLVNLTNTWCTKRTEETFCYLCTVWWLLGQDQETAQTLQNNKSVSTLLQKCYVKVKTWNTRTSRSSTTPMKNRLPGLTPNWCSRRTNRPQMFENGKFGITEVLKKLHIDI